jgi:hypothetical protein
MQPLVPLAVVDAFCLTRRLSVVSCLNDLVESEMKLVLISMFASQICERNVACMRQGQKLMSFTLTVLRSCRVMDSEIRQLVGTNVSLFW